MVYSQPVTDIITQRFSCRSYLASPIASEKRQQLADFIAAHQAGPFGSPTRFELVAATETDRQALRGLGTYGFIKNPPGFIVGAMGESAQNLEDFGYAMERIVLFATDIGLSTCWLGGSFSKSSFAKKISLNSGESAPAVTSVGHVAGAPRDDQPRPRVDESRRHAWDELFFDQKFGAPLSRQAAGPYAAPLEMVRLGPSASNKQPWRIVRDGNVWHFYLQRTRGYGNSVAFRLLRLADIQRLDMGIAMSHFELTANELGLQGQWVIAEPGIEKPDEITAYTVSWAGAR